MPFVENRGIEGASKTSDLARAVRSCEVGWPARMTWRRVRHAGWCAN